MTGTVGVLTFHRCINYGSYWQARCLVEGLRARGHDAVLLDHDSRRVNHLEWRCALRPVLPTPVPPSDRALYRRKIHAFFEAFSALPLSRRFSLEDPADMESFDAVVVGSDEVWNLRHPWYGGHHLFFGGGVRAPRTVSYAASFGSWEAREGLEPHWADRLRGFDSLAVRDENSRALIRSALELEPELTLDPCLQFELPPLRTESEPIERGRYAAVYGHNFSGWFAREVRRWARSRGLRLVSVGYRNDWADEQWLDAGPHDFAGLMAGAEAVATNFFHGCVFALRNATPFACELSPYRSAKIRDLLAQLGGQRHLVAEDTPAASYDARLEQPVEPQVLRAIERLRGTGDAYLEAALA
jgi:hypothetical protein